MGRTLPAPSLRTGRNTPCPFSVRAVGQRRFPRLIRVPKMSSAPHRLNCVIPSKSGQRRVQIRIASELKWSLILNSSIPSHWRSQRRKWITALAPPFFLPWRLSKRNSATMRGKRSRFARWNDNSFRALICGLSWSKISIASIILLGPFFSSYQCNQLGFADSRKTSDFHALQFAGCPPRADGGWPDPEELGSGLCTV